MKKNMSKVNSLKEQKQILEDNIKWEQDMIDNNKHYENDKLHMSFGPDHYRRAIEYDKEDLKKVNSAIEERENIKKLKEAREKAVSIANKTKEDFEPQTLNKEKQKSKKK